MEGISAVAGSAKARCATRGHVNANLIDRFAPVRILESIITERLRPIGSLQVTAWRFLCMRELYVTHHLFD